MKTEINILIAFILNLAFSIFEFLGGIMTGSVAIISDSLHDFGDALSISLSYFLEKKSKKQPDNEYTYGYIRYSVLGGLITSLILLINSIFVIINAIEHLIHPNTINYDGMILFAIIGVVVNFVATCVTHGEDSLNQKAVNLHMLEDVMGWIVVLIGAVVMKFTDFSFIDPIMSLGVAIFILTNSIKNLREIIDLFLEKTPHGIDIEKIKEQLINLENVIDVHHIHVWSMDGHYNYATLHVVVNNKNGSLGELKEKVRGKLREMDVGHATIEVEFENEHCQEKHCHLQLNNNMEHCCCHHH